MPTMIKIKECDSCGHKNVCKFVEQRKKLSNEVLEVVENNDGINELSVSVTCSAFYSDIKSKRETSFG